MDGTMRRSLWLFIIVGVLLLLAGAVIYSTLASLGHSPSLTGSPPSDTAVTETLIAAISVALCGWLAVLLIARSHHRRCLAVCPFCGSTLRVDDRACAHCGSRFA